MKKLLVILLLAAAAGTPFILGFEAESRYRGLLAELESAGYQLQEHDYQRGILTSTASSKLSMPMMTTDGSSSELAFRLDSEIQHGPWSIEKGWFGDLAYFETAFFHNDQPVFPEKLNALIATRLLFNGEGQTSLDMPSFDTPLKLDNDLQMAFSGLHGTMDFNVVKGVLNIDLSSDGMSLTAPDSGQMTIGKLTLKSDSQRGIADLMMGGGKFTIDSLAFNDAANLVDVNLKDLEIFAESSAEGQTINLTAYYAVREMLINNESYKNAKLELEFTSLNAKAIAGLQQAFQDMRTQMPTDPQQQGILLMAEMMKAFPTLLKDNPGFAIKTIEVDTPEGPVKAGFSVKTSGLTILDISNPFAILPKLDSQVEVQVPETLVKSIMRQSLQKDMQQGLANNTSTELTDEDVQALVDQQLEIQLNSFIDQQFVERKAGLLVATARLKGGKLTVNGKPFNLGNL